ncbi:carbohydrate ABC transporter permease [Streptomyces sp. NPDC003247]|uniref:carbohydrate ABC transporter permease n=1 Tax=Streptomyces sp. NPDC003247 TaxID=3364677 RepID=UPI00369741D8
MAIPMRQRQLRGAVLFLSPFLILFSLVTLAPLCYAAWLSLFSEQSSGLGLGGVEKQFTGIGNYARVLGDAEFLHGFLTIAAYVAIYVPVLTLSALAVALLLDSGLAAARRVTQVIVFIPHAVPGLVAALIWLYLYTPGLSPVTDWLGQSSDAASVASTHPLLSVVNVAMWEWLGYNVVIFYAALQAVPQEVVEAATLDGVNRLQLAVRIKAPLIRPAVAMAALFTVIGGIQLFNEPKILLQASSSITRTWTPNLYTQDAAFNRNDYGTAAAASLLIAGFAAVLSFVVTRLANRRSTA